MKRKEVSAVILNLSYRNTPENLTIMLRGDIWKNLVIGVDSCLIPEEKFNPEVLPPVEATDLLSYLVLDTSFYTKQ